MKPSLTDGRTLSDRVLQTLRQLIVEGELAPGTRLVDSELAERLQISRATVRDAFRRLQHEGAIVNYPYRGYFVAKFDTRDVADLLSLRGLLEGYAGKIAIDALTEADFAEMERVTGRIERLEYQTDVQEIRELDIRFHDVVVERAGHPLLLELWSVLDSRLVVLNALSRDVLRMETADTARRHRAYIAELRSRDPERVARAAADHYQFYLRRLEEAMAEADETGT